MIQAHRLLAFSIAMTGTLVSYSTAFATTIPNTDDPTTFLGPTARVGLTSNIGNESAFSVAGEAAARNFRLSGTLGWKIGDNQRFKATAEYLWQKIAYGFFSGNSEYWAQQGTVGVVYQYDLANVAYNPQVGFNAYVLYSPSKTFGLDMGTFVNPNGITQNFTDNRRATGARGYGISPVASVTPWTGALLTGEVNYENIGYDNDYPVNQNARGFGVTARFNQAIMPHVDLGLVAGIRQPFNNYEAKIRWLDVPYFRDCTLGLFGDYTVGKHTLPDTYNVGISADFILDNRVELAADQNYKDEGLSFKPVVDNLLKWTSEPAVYMPVVLSVADEQVELS